MAIVEHEPQVEPKELDEIGAILMRAADLLRGEVGWCQGQVADAAGNRCVLGALVVASIETDKPHLWKMSAAALRRSLGRAPSVWNDQSGRTKEEVIEALERAAIGG